MYKYEVISLAKILRDFIDVEYIDEEQRDLVDIADGMYEVGLKVNDMLPEYQALYDKYGEEFWAKVSQDIAAIDSQVDTNNVDVLILDYNGYLSGVIEARQ